MKKTRFPRYVVLCAVGIIINYVGALLATRLNLPLYLDAIRTIGVSVSGGLLPGITVGFATNLINSITDIVNVKTNFVLNVYVAPGACREAADFHSRPFASAGGGYCKRQILLSFTIASLSTFSKSNRAPLL